MDRCDEFSYARIFFSAPGLLHSGYLGSVGCVSGMARSRFSAPLRRRLPEGGSGSFSGAEEEKNCCFMLNEVLVF